MAFVPFKCMRGREEAEVPALGPPARRLGLSVRIQGVSPLVAELHQQGVPPVAVVRGQPLRLHEAGALVHPPRPNAGRVAVQHDRGRRRAAQGSTQLRDAAPGPGRNVHRSDLRETEREGQGRSPHHGLGMHVRRRRYVRDGPHRSNAVPTPRPLKAAATAIFMMTPASAVREKSRKPCGSARGAGKAPEGVPGGGRWSSAMTRPLFRCIESSCM
eukprot:scaffold66439_cov67-Phaeocystis_antarctica.AAC.3